MPTRRTVRVAEVLRQQLTNQIRRTGDLQELILTILDIEVSPDLRHAFVYFSVLNSDQTPAGVINRLNVHRHEWQQAIGKALQTKFTPHLHFRFDESVTRGNRVMQILQEIDQPEQEPPTSE